MTHTIGLASQKGGVCKSGEARAIATTYAAGGWAVTIYDLDIDQSTSHNWNIRREQGGIEPRVQVETFGSFARAFKSISDDVDLAIFDGPPRANAGTVEMARAVDLMILPTGTGLDDMEPTVLLANSLVEQGVPAEKIAIALCRVGDSGKELVEARAYLGATPYHLLGGALYEMTAYRRAHDAGLSMVETPYPSPREKAAAHVQAIVDRLAYLTK